jgi:hypothetical protein
MLRDVLSLSLSLFFFLQERKEGTLKKHQLLLALHQQNT